MRRARRPPAAQGFEAQLPLGWFDDTEFESRAPHEWLSSFRRANRKADGLALVFEPAGGDASAPSGPAVGTWRYTKVHKFAADEDGGKYLVSTMRLNGGMGGKPYWEDRVNLCFTGEEARAFAARVAAAHAHRDAAEEALLRHYYIANMPVAELRQISAPQLRRIVALAASTVALRRAALDPQALVEETRLEYARALNAMLFERELRQPAFRSQVRLAHTEPRVARAPPSLAVTPAWLPAAYDYGACARSFGAIAAAALPEAVHAMGGVQAECLALQVQRVLLLDVPAPIRLEAYTHLQQQRVMRFVQYLREAWQPALKGGVLAAIRHATPGWRQPAPRPSVYAERGPHGREGGGAPPPSSAREELSYGSRPRRMTRAINLMVVDALRFVTHSSLAAYADLLCAHAARRSYVEDPEVLGAGLGPGLGSAASPLFELELVARDGQLLFSTPAEDFSTAPVALIDETVRALVDLLPVDPFDLSFGEDSSGLEALRPVEPGEPLVEACKARLEQALAASTGPLADFLAGFARHLPHVELDVPAHVAAFAAADKPPEERPSLAAMRAKALEHSAARARLEAEVPRTVAIGMYLVSLEGVRQQLLDKQSEAISLTLRLVESRAREAAQALAAKFAQMHETLLEQPQDIERLTEMKAYMAECMGEVKAMQLAIEDMGSHYDSLEVGPSRAADACLARPCTVTHAH